MSLPRELKMEPTFTKYKILYFDKTSSFCHRNNCLMKWLLKKKKTIGKNKNNSVPPFYLSPNSNYFSASHRLHSNHAHASLANAQESETGHTQHKSQLEPQVPVHHSSNLLKHNTNSFPPINDKLQAMFRRQQFWLVICDPKWGRQKKRSAGDRVKKEK